MKQTVKYILYTVLAAVLIGCMTVAYIAGKQSRKPLVCKGVRIEILDSTENCFVTVPDVRKYLDRGYGKVIGLPIDSIDLVKVEQIIDSKCVYVEGMKYPVIINGTFMLLGYEVNPQRDRIIEVFKSFPN